jgi:glyoxylase-like metal-dependent hydrolase (beta-lactamase superfamily II)
MSDVLQLTTYLSAYKPIPSSLPDWDPARQATWPATTATLLQSGRQGVLIDALMTTTEGAALARWIEGEGVRDLAAIYVTHGHADHFYGATTVLEHYPDARLVALRDIADAAREQTSPGYLKVWGSFFPGQITQEPAVPDPVHGEELSVGGHLVAAVDVGSSDVPSSSVVHIPELATVVSGDVAYNDMHMWLAGSTTATRVAWLAALDRIEALGPTTIITGHKDPGAPDDDARRVLDQSREYLSHFDQAATAAGSPADIIAAMLSRYPDLGNPYTLWVAAHDQPELFAGEDPA